MLAVRGIYDGFWNPEVQGVQHQYEVIERAGEKLVIDHATKLTWQQGGSSLYMTFENAKAYVRELNEEGFAGYHDWRLPTLEEAMYLMEREKKNGDLYIDPVFDRTQRYIWTSDKFSESSCWVAYFFGNGYARFQTS